MAVISSQLNNSQNSILFAKTKRETPRFVFVAIFSCLLMIADGHYHITSPLRHFFSYITIPLQFIADVPTRLSEEVKFLWVTKQALKDENYRLKVKHLILQEELQHLQNLRYENTKLKALLSLTEVIDQKSIAARVMSVDTNSIQQVIVINKGKRHHVSVGQPVLDHQGVLGQVIEVSPITSRVLLISDAMSAVPVKNNRTGEMGILAGTHNKSQLELFHLPKSSSIMAGDLLVTSGLGGCYPEGYPVGRVTEVISQPGDEFIKVHVAPIAALETSQLVLLVWANQYHSIMAKHVERLHKERSFL